MIYEQILCRMCRHYEMITADMLPYVSQVDIKTWQCPNCGENAGFLKESKKKPSEAPMKAYRFWGSNRQGPDISLAQTYEGTIEAKSEVGARHEAQKKYKHVLVLNNEKVK
jgi:hypothetical protein